ncbi:MAG: hypothetical protein H6745_08880 [Deltaproteobacteria bacterium]|nr:hypothetical protein [Deltaproteobacteria bacterium]
MSERIPAGDHASAPRGRRATLAIAMLLGAALSSGCFDYDPLMPPGLFGAASTGTPSVGDRGELPCDVVDLLVTKCQSCHGETPRAGAPMALVTWDDLTAKSPSDPTKTAAELSLERMRSTTDPMPPRPAPAVGAAALGAFTAWLDGGTQQGACATDVAPTPLASSGPLGHLPCEVEDLLAARCRGCHAATPRNGALVPLVTYDDLARPAPTAPSETVAAYASARMHAADAPMPPAGADTLDPAAVAAFDAWIAAGQPEGSCEATPDPFAAAQTCSSGRIWTGGNGGSSEMHPGVACIACHTTIGRGSAPVFLAAGTVFGTAHDPDDCDGVRGGVTVEITDAVGRVYRRKANKAGNFYVEAAGDGFTVPYTARVIGADGASRWMNGAQYSGDCNSCHTAYGLNDAPGRVLAP